MDKHDQALTYSTYLALEQLLGAQQLRSGDDGAAEHDEMLFILVHQVYELWFKQVLHELDYTMVNLAEDQLGLVFQTLKRVRAILKVMVGQLDVLETMTPLQFSSFRDRLDRSSGLQSFQFRELEFALGLKDAAVLERYEDSSTPHRRLTRRLREPSLWDGVLGFIQTRGYDIPARVRNRDLTTSNAADEDVQRVLLDIYRDNPELTQLLEALTDIDEGLQEWRYRHVKMVQRTIGSKSGTGGTTGVAYLKATLDKTVFPDLWIVRASL